MNEAGDRHHPAPEFVAGLEREIVRAWRAETTGASVIPMAPTRRWERIRMAAMLAIGVLGGFGAQFASAQVQGARARSELERSVELERQVQEYRVSVARAEHERMRSAFAAGIAAERDLNRAALELRMMEVNLARLQLDLAEIRESNAAPRNELWAPVLGGRDFVRERQNLMAALAEEELRVAEAERRTTEQRVRMGIDGVGALESAQLRVAEKTLALQRLTAEIALREEAVAKRLAPEEVTRRLQRTGLELELAGAQQRLAVGRERVTRLRRMTQVGAMSELDLKRAELEVLEQEMALERLSAELERLRRGQRDQSMDWRFGRSGGD